MELNEYQKKAMGTCMPSCMNYSYMMGNLSAEVGEFQGKVCKAQRHGDISFSNDGDMVEYRHAVRCRCDDRDESGTDEGSRGYLVAVGRLVPGDGMES